MKCQDCGSNEAFVHLSEVVDGDVCSFWLCSTCSQIRQNISKPASPSKVGYQKESGNLASFLGDDFLHPHDSVSEISTIVCPSCDYMLEKWRETDLLGCPRCYQAFASVLLAHMNRFHGHATHLGKIPLQRRAHGDQLSAIKKVRLVLEKAVAREDFEEAARQRDLLKEIKSGKFGSDCGSEGCPE